MDGDRKCWPSEKRASDVRNPSVGPGTSSVPQGPESSESAPLASDEWPPLQRDSSAGQLPPLVGPNQRTGPRTDPEDILRYFRSPESDEIQRLLDNPYSDIQVPRHPLLPASVTYSVDFQAFYPTIPAGWTSDSVTHSNAGAQPPLGGIYSDHPGTSSIPPALTDSIIPRGRTFAEVARSSSSPRTQPRRQRQNPDGPRASPSTSNAGTSPH